MGLLRVILAAMLIAILGYTAKTISMHGFDLLPVFFGDMKAMAWPGQFNFDFMMMLLLSGLWTAWRNKFSVKGLLLAIPAFLGGIMFLSIYLLYLTTKENSVKAILVGDR